MNKRKSIYRCEWCRILFVSLVLLFLLVPGCAYSQPKFKKVPMRASKYSYLPSGYNRVGNTQLYYKQNSNAIDMLGYYNGYYYSSTFSDYGYKLSVQVGSNSAVRVDCLNGTTNYGVTVQPSIEQQGELARICYVVTNTNEEDVVVSLGTHADVMIGNNDRAPITRRVDTFGQTYGLTMKDGQGAQLCVLFGSGLAGVTPISDYWFGYYYLNGDAYQMVGNYSPGDSYMVENGSYDSGMGWCWKDRTITAGSTIVFSYVIGVGEVNLEPNSSFEVTPDDADGWNDLSRPHRLSLNGSYESPAGLDGVIDYAVEDSEEWIALTDTLASGDEFTASLVAMFDATKPTHVVKFRTRDLVGNTTMLHPIEYKDVNFHALTGIEEKTYTGDSLFQTNLTCDMEEGQYELKTYRDNVDAGTASFNLEGVFPYSIGRKTYTYTIHPQPLSGELSLADTEFVYNGQVFTPDWHFTNEAYTDLEKGRDYEVIWSGNKLPGIGLLTVSGKNNYTGSLTASFNIDKAQLTENLYSLTLPDEDITYDEQSHGASVTTTEGVGEAILSYIKQGETDPMPVRPTEAGDYTIYLEFTDGTLYYGQEPIPVGTFSIYQFSAGEWAILQAVLPQLSEMGWSQPWDVSQGMKSVSTLHGLTIEKGHVTGLDLSGQNLTGMFPYFILALPQLQHINLADNHLTGDIGMTTYVVAQQNPTWVVNARDINISGNQFYGNIGIFANCFTNLKALDASENRLEDVFPMIPSTVTDLNISKQTISRVVPLHLANLSVDSIATKVPSILFYDHANRTFTPNVNLLCTAPNGSWGMIMSYQNGTLAIPYVSDPNAYYGESGDTLNVAVVNNNGTREGSTFFISLSFDEGDGNFDGRVNILDLQTSIGYMMEKYQDRPYNFTAANLWKDELINVQDVICHVNLLMNNESVETEQTAGTRKKAPISTVANDAIVYVQDGRLMLDTNLPVAAFDITIGGVNSMNIDNKIELAGMTISMKAQRDGLRVIGYSLNGTCIPVGITSIGTLEQVAYVRNAMLSDYEANAICVSYDGAATGMEFVRISPVDNSTLYDLQGRKVNVVSRKGIYIQNGQKVVK